MKQGKLMLQSHLSKSHDLVILIIIKYARNEKNLTALLPFYEEVHKVNQSTVK